MWILDLKIKPKIIKFSILREGLWPKQGFKKKLISPKDRKRRQKWQEIFATKRSGKDFIQKIPNTLLTQ